MSADEEDVAARVQQLRGEVSVLEAELASRAELRQAIVAMTQRVKRMRQRLPRARPAVSDADVAVRLLIDASAQVLVIAGATAVDPTLGSVAIGLAFVVLVFHSVGVFEGKA